MNLNKRIALLLAAVMLLTVPFAATAEELDTELEGYIIELVEGGFLMNDKELGEIMLNVDEQTVLDGLLLEEEIAVGQYVLVWYDGRTTRSLPPQAHADRVGSYELNGVVSETMEDGVFLLHDDTFGDVLVHVDGTPGHIYPGMTVKVYYDGVMALSEPGQVAAREIIVPTLTGVASELDGHSFTLTDEEGNTYQIVTDEYTVVGRLLPAEEETPAADVDEGAADAAEGDDADKAAASAADAATEGDESDEIEADVTEADQGSADEADEAGEADEPAATQPPTVDLEAILAEGDVVTVYYTGHAIGDEPVPSEAAAEANADGEPVDGEAADLSEAGEQSTADENGEVRDEADVSEDGEQIGASDAVVTESDESAEATSIDEPIDSETDETDDAETDDTPKQYLALELVVLTPPEAE